MDSKNSESLRNEHYAKLYPSPRSLTLLKYERAIRCLRMGCLRTHIPNKMKKTPGNFETARHLFGKKSDILVL
ncbi:hypothetical protein [Prevotella sp. HUN102]|uniref:hypothetical protein n=1 Tax=Prevotella sp. HUN102 TaxID=1392486 RepID=UPI0012DC94D6|nr:hypothetical protein [Prevotella sp. HUN102]